MGLARRIDLFSDVYLTSLPPLCRYRWTRNGSEFDPGTMQRNDSGTLVITTTNGNVASKFQGVYRCYANNSLGTAMSTKSRIIAESECPPVISVIKAPLYADAFKPLSSSSSLYSRLGFTESVHSRPHCDCSSAPCSCPLPPPPLA